MEALLGKTKTDPVTGPLSEFTVDNIHIAFCLFGLAFGPDGIKHFSQLSPAEKAVMLDRVPVLKSAHTDWPKPLSWVPRTATTWTQPSGRIWPILAGNTTADKPIPDRGRWFVKRGYMAWTTEDGWHIRFGFRWDDVDGYITFPAFTIKKM